MLPALLRPLIEALRPLAARFDERQRHLYLVGGVVRDALLGIEPNGDVDATTDATPEEIVEIVRPVATHFNLTGLRFGTVAFHYHGVPLEVTTHRGEAYDSSTRKPTVHFVSALAEDLLRRDFTVNAMAVEVTSDDPTLIDPFGGMEDLLARRLRTPMDPRRSFSDDPLRMLRCARFIARLDLEPQRALVDAVHELAPRLEVVSRERIRDELSRLLVVPDPSKGLWFLVDTPLAAEFLPELPALRLEQDPIHHHKDVLAHTIAVTASCSPRLRLRLAALLHDIGKPATREIGPNGVSFHFHDVVGARMARRILRELRYPNDLVDDVARLVELHLRFHTYAQGWSDAAVRRYVRDAGELLEDLNELTTCDATTRNERRRRMFAERMATFEERARELAERDALRARRPPIDGLEVMRILEIPPGPAVGRAMRFLTDLTIDEGLNDPDEARRRLLEWWRSHSGEEA
ncbi:polynucleotide adenylyltransferase/metal dependent phosphohydrolase [Acidimicrobium ferrooxidans DSM 10331]|uniref:Polynucleotide adenylyltransferase/metal dependent phosphohydrolase n=1 Tax=Acidimicrobium ferrooxidans (strain DSM 10331 / JCM 15462 / NBRC 103882 / ICP) TaxID=525909 RepID=C7M1E9_ACIFD|nr:CCA tRNA nucleotidyltransferase [Acidimicrobium ferrooxidans]ACU52998.1 polynucleotide adenylyltransferase/metal dependent phosphohydrolase [Acidimicrobium ferrooxidans DSM 10331]